MDKMNSVSIAIAWCLAWGNERQPQFDVTVLQQMCDGLRNGEEVPAEVTEILQQVEELNNLQFPETLEDLQQPTEKHSILWKSKVGLVYGGVTKVKQYVFEASKLSDIRGASALLDRINLIDLPAFFGCDKSSNYEQCQKAREYCQNIRE